MWERSVQKEVKIGDKIQKIVELKVILDFSSCILYVDGAQE